MITKCAVLNKVNEVLEIREIEVPTLKRGQVLVSIDYSGLCGSQMNEIRGLRREDKYLPHLLGHEASGNVVQIGDDVTKVKVGDTVVATWLRGIGLEGGPTKYGKFNAGSITTFQNYSVISENRLIKVSNHISSSILAMFGCMIPTGVGTVLNVLNIQAGKEVVIFGAGGNIGSVALLGSKWVGARVIAVDKPEKKEYVEKLGCDEFLSLETDKDWDVVRSLRTDYGIETTGILDIVNLAYESISDNGAVSIVGNLPHGVSIKIDPLDLSKGRVKGSWGGFVDRQHVDIDNFIANVLPVYEELNLDRLNINIYDLGDINKAIEDFGNSYGKVLIRCCE